MSGGTNGSTSVGFPMQPQFPPHQPPPVPGGAWQQPWHPPHGPQQQAYGTPPFGVPVPTARRRNGTVWALVGGGVGVLVLVLAVLAATGAFRSGPPHYTEAQAVAHVRSAAPSSEVGGAFDAQIVRALHLVCTGISDGRTTVSELLTEATRDGG